mgnify:CR=1 FL=1
MNGEGSGKTERPTRLGAIGEYRIQVHRLLPTGAVAVDFPGTELHDLAMLGAAKGYLEGLYEQAQKAQGAQQQQAVFDRAKEIMERLVPRGPFPLPFPIPGGEEAVLDLTVRDVEITRLEELIRVSQEHLVELQRDRKAGRA